MKKYILSIILVILIILVSFTRIFNLGNSKQNSNINTDIIILEKANNYINIYVYNEVSKNVELREIVIENKDFFNIDFYVKLILENTKFIKKNMQLLAVYELKDNSILIKLSEEFKNLNEQQLKILQESIDKTLKPAFPNITSIVVQFDTNN